MIATWSSSAASRTRSRDAGDLSGVGLGRRQLSPVRRAGADRLLAVAPPKADALTEPVRQAVRNFVPVLISRGAVQLTAYIDQWIASWLPTGAVTALANAQLLYTLPVSLFGVSISAVGTARDVGRRGARARLRALRARIDAGLRRLAFFVVPSAVAFAALGDVIAAALLQRGRFDRRGRALRLGDSRRLVDRTPGDDDGAAVFGGALRARRHEAAAALSRSCGWRASTTLGYVVAIVLPPRLGIDPLWGAAGLDGFVGRRRLDRVRAAARQPQRAHRPDRSARGLQRAAVDGRGRRGGRRVRA